MTYYYILTDKNVAHQCGWQTKDYHQDICKCQVDDEIIRDSSHPGRPQNNSNHETVADETNYEYNAVGDAVQDIHCGRVSIVKLKIQHRGG